MRIRYILITIILISCAQNTKENKATVVEVQDAIQLSEDVPRKNENASNDISSQQLRLLTEVKAIKKYGTPSSIEQFMLDDAQGEFRSSISYKYTVEERQSESILIEEVTWEKDENTWITVWYEVQQEKSVPKEVYEWKKGSEF
ncbi:hypothetical protein [Aquimarina sp. SS2-1]|uniref:hypothetical protein n=1 Tax=Aquimarina besae TaxID=3342247 RepID=UPI003671D2D5